MHFICSYLVCIFFCLGFFSASFWVNISSSVLQPDGHSGHGSCCSTPPIFLFKFFLDPGYFFSNIKKNTLYEEIKFAGVKLHIDRKVVLLCLCIQNSYMFCCVRINLSQHVDNFGYQSGPIQRNWLNVLH